ncbi:putative histone-lysine N-methyltransferase 1 isoform X1 [Linepithema humile]|uniref:putative histone-lysine N-methyltransferase 1 isoform X1 n=2 Tax=Linepithema humile TaxID=83485 RepID=UPI000623AB51|nr:PREDICTED: probable cyclin-dependent serine/threonine-protein kinase DDB_G0292550 isoform X2 [Linepithema humile]
MMNKRKIIASNTSDEDDSFEHRHSSLRVNMSYIANLTDSGNGSLYRSEIENIERADNRNLQESQVKKEIHLEDTSSKERALETNCKQLKDEILNKTKATFNGDNELSIKTAMVLGNKKNHFVSSIHNSNSENKSILILKTNNHCLRNKITMEHKQYTNQQRKDRYLNIIATPTSKNGQNSKQTVDKSRLIQKRLFVTNDKQVEKHTKCRIIEDIVLQNKCPIPPKQTNQSSSPILSSSNKRAGSKLCLQNQSENYNNTFSTEHSVQNVDIGVPITCSTFIEDNTIREKKNKSSCNKTNNDFNISHATHTMNKVISMEMTEICGIIQTSKEQDRNSNANNCIEDREEEKSKVKSLDQKKNITIQRLKDIHLNKFTVQNNIACSNVPCANVANDAVSTRVPVVPVQVSIEEVAATTKIHNTLQVQERNTTNQSKKECMLLLSDNSTNSITQLSLNVNTSLDVMVKTSKVNSSSNYKIIDTNQSFGATITNNKRSIVLNDQYKSINSTQTSLQMNTSIDSMHETRLRRNNRSIKQSLIQEKGNVKDLREKHLYIDNQYLITENKETDDVDFLENISLFERLKNISTQNQFSHNVQSNIYEIGDKEKAENDKSNNVTSLIYQRNDHTSNSGNNYSCVEGTLYPISRSVLFKSLLKYKTQNINHNAESCNNNANLIDNKENKIKTKLNVLNTKVSNKTPKSTETPKTADADTVMLKDMPSSNYFLIQNQLIITEDTCNKARFEIGDKTTISSQNMECIVTRKGKRKLLPLNENSQLCSITPIEEDKCTAKESTFGKKSKKFKKKRSKRKLADVKTNTSSIKHNIVNERWSDNDCDTFENKRKKKKVRKPKKIMSKKIVIKKIVDENVLNILEENRQNKENRSIENKDSLNDFVRHRTIPTQWYKHKSQKIVIVTTGLSKEDQSLVKSIIKSLGMAEMEINVSKRTTHVVSTGVRTVNLLRGIIRGCWLVTLEWVLTSLENNTWLDPEKFEMKHFSKAVEENRKDRQLFGLSYIPELFSLCGLIYVEHKTTIPCDTLKELIKTAGGHITENIKQAKIIIGMNGLKETWIIDSITTGELQSTKLYQRESSS